MHHQSQAAVIANDLDSMTLRIEALPAEPAYTEALNHVQKAHAAILRGRSSLHEQAQKAAAPVYRADEYDR